MLSLPVWLKSPWRGSDPLFQFAVIRVHRRSSAFIGGYQSSSQFYPRPVIRQVAHRGGASFFSATPGLPQK